MLNRIQYELLITYWLKACVYEIFLVSLWGDLYKKNRTIQRFK